MKIYCSGIGGIGLSAYAGMQVANGHTVMGSDRGESDITRALQELGVTVVSNQDGSQIPEDTDLFVYSEAVAKDAPERVRAAALGIESQSYFKAVGQLSKDAFVIAVCGTHGKSSTTSMAAAMLLGAAKDPSVIVGTKVPELGNKNWRKGGSDIFLVEACEYRRSFHYLSPDLVLMTTVDGDHFDAYADIEEYRQAFVDFLKLLPANAPVIIHGNDVDCLHVAQLSGHPVINADTQELPELSVPGLHMRQNAQLVMTLADTLHIDRTVAAAALKGFTGTWRRMEVKGPTIRGAVVIDDYAHHPKEIRATLQAIREAYPKRRLVCVFQPHTHDRTRKLYDDFLVSFKDANLVVIPNIYNARKDIETGEVPVPQLVTDIAKGSSVECLNGESLESTRTYLSQTLRADDVLVCMGAGDITKLAAQMVER